MTLPVETTCQCTPPSPDGVIQCPRHGVEKTLVLWQRCQKRGRMFEAWEAGYGPGQGGSPPKPKKKAGSRPCTKPCGKPSIARQAWSVITAVGAFIKGGCKFVDRDEYERRLRICDVCEHRDNHRCGICLCYVAIKAKAVAWQCPDSRWPAATPQTRERPRTDGPGMDDSAGSR